MTQPSAAMTLALDVDGVLLDPDRSGKGHWSNELTARFGIKRSQLRDAFFRPCWSDVLSGRVPIEDALGSALAEINQAVGTDVGLEDVLSLWFDADYVPFPDAIDLASKASLAGHQVVLATNQEHRRAAYLRKRLGSAFRVDAIFYAADLGYQKSDSRFFDAVSTRLGLGPAARQTVVFVDDDEGNVDVAAACGWTAVHATPEGQWRDEVADLLGL